MDTGALQARFIRSYWALLFGSLAAASVIFALSQRSYSSTRAVVSYVALVGWTLMCRFASRFDRRWAVTAAALGVIPLMAALLYTPEVARVLEVRAVGRAAFAAPSALLIGTLWGWPGALIAVVLGVLTLGADGSAVEILSAATVLAFVGLSGASMGQLIKSLERANARLGEAANRDAMTGLMNRRALETVGKLEGRWLVTMWDVDGLKRVNDSQGHAAGDTYLLSFVRALESATAADDQLFRTGGDEFMGLHENFTDARALEMRVHRDFPHVSMGWAMVDDGDLHGAMIQADRVLYDAKAAREERVRAVAPLRHPTLEQRGLA
jgi:diguanylate cyclase (GGDEF)-like protein